MAMYYNAQSQPQLHQDPNVQAWSRTHQSMLSTGQASANGAPLPSPTPAYGLAYANGAPTMHHPHHGPPQMHQHHPSLSHSMQGYPSPPAMGPPGMRAPTPGTNGVVISPHLQQQLLKAEVSRLRLRGVVD